ncbi:hypothetical protein MSAS_46660 [Mycobacterium saskatchewanense]|nr:hypothetical protein MSAS_46660 [Mycobacterium saskatchewanense]
MIVCDNRTDADPVAAAAQLVATTGVCLMPSFDVTRSLGVGREEWTRFARHWERLAPDPYAADLGVTRLRRYGQYAFRDGIMRPMPPGVFAQPHDSNPLYIGKDRIFAPPTDEFSEDPLLPAVVKLLARVAHAVEPLDEAAEWNVKVHLFRTRSSPGRSGFGDGVPTPEGLHRDGVTLVSSLLIGRRNAIGGESLVCDADGRTVLTATLAEPGTLLLGDDRRTLHGVSPVRPIDGSGPAQRDVLVTTFASAWP